MCKIDTCYMYVYIAANFIKLTSKCTPYQFAVIFDNRYTFCSAVSKTLKALWALLFNIMHRN
jgi:hypothetical protein